MERKEGLRVNRDGGPILRVLSLKDRRTVVTRSYSTPTRSYSTPKVDNRRVFPSPSGRGVSPSRCLVYTLPRRTGGWGCPLEGPSVKRGGKDWYGGVEESDHLRMTRKFCVEVTMRTLRKDSKEECMVRVEYTVK